ncbi:MAG TPA: M48 family metallopeptidase [Chitinophagaceae bacterium]|nr:M48 family metallopeptidase [Chitinophagaceae bacterium]
MHIEKNSVFFLFLSFISLSCAAQLQPVYSFQKDDTILKKTYYDRSIGKKDMFLSLSDKENARDYKKICEDHFKEIGKLWRSDRLVTAPEANGYLQSIVQKILSANKELKKTDARIVFSRDWWPNAYSMGEGTIAINAGLLVYLDNEAELVFVLCHELAHYYLDHTTKAIKKYVETVNSEAYQKELKRLAKTEFGVNKQLEELSKSFAFSSRKHSRENEAAADRMAFNFMKKTGYDCNAIKTGLALLDKIDDSLLYKPLALQQVFHFNEYPFKKKWIQKESSIFSQLDENDSPLSRKEKDSLKTHPDCTKRISLLSDSLASIQATGEKFLVAEKLFNRLKKDFFVEMTEQCYRDKNLSRNLYYSLLLLQSQENIPVAVYSVSRCLNQLYDYQKAHQLGTKIDTENKSYPAEYNDLLRMLGRLRLDEIASLNYNFCKQYASLMKGYEGFEGQMNKAKKLKE